MTKAKLKDIGIRAAKTFIQAFLANISIETVLASNDRSLVRSMLISATAAGISAVMNLALAALENDYL